MYVRESTIEQELIEKLGELKYALRPDIRDRAAMERNFREKFEALNRVRPGATGTDKFISCIGDLPWRRNGGPIDLRSGVAWRIVRWWSPCMA